MTKREIKQRIIAALTACEGLADIPMGPMAQEFSSEVSSKVFGVFDKAGDLRDAAIQVKMIGRNRFPKFEDDKKYGRA